MSDDPRIAQLEALLARVRQRSAEPRRTAGRTPPDTSPGGAPLEATEAPKGAHAPPRSPLPPPFVTPALFEGAPRPPPGSDVEPTIAERAATPSAPRAPEPSRVRAIDAAFADVPPMEVVELDVDPEPSFPPPSLDAPADAARPPSQEPELLESRSRLVAAAPTQGDDVDALLAQAAEPDAPSETTLSSAEPIAPSRVSGPTLAASDDDDRNEEDEEAPTSSRRAISLEEKLEQLAEDDGLHTAPPESGKLPAVQEIELALPDEPRGEPFSPRGLEVAAFAPAAPLRAPTFGELLDATLAL